MSKTTKIMLGGTEYEVPRLNIGQIEEMSELDTAAPFKRTLGTIRIALQRATPPIGPFQEIETTAEEIGTAYAKLMIAAGLAKEAGKEDGEGPNAQAPKHKARGEAKA